MKKIILFLAGFAFLATFSFAQEDKFQDLGKAIYLQDVAKVKALIDSGIDPNQSQNGDAPIGIAIRRNNMEIFKMIVNHPKFEVNKRYEERQLGDALHIFSKSAIADAVNVANLEMVQTLLDKGADVDAVIRHTTVSSGQTFKEAETSVFLNTLLNTWSKDNNKIAELVEAKVKKPKMKLNTNNEFEGSVDQIALCIKGAYPEYESVLISFIKRNFDVNFTIPVTDQSIKVLQSQGLTQQIDFLKKYGSRRLLDMAVESNRLKLSQWLIDNGAKIDKWGDKGGYLWNYASSIEMIKLLVKNGIDINTCSPGSNFNILQLNIKRLEPKDFEELIKMGADVHHKDAMGKSVRDHVPSAPLLPKNIKKNIKILEKYEASDNNNR